MKLRRLEQWFEQHLIVICLAAILLSIAVPALLRWWKAQRPAAPPGVRQPLPPSSREAER